MTEENKEAVTATEYPEGGAKAWLVVAGCFCIMVYTFGYLNTFG